VEAARGEFFSQGIVMLRESAGTVNWACGQAVAGKKKPAPLLGSVGSARASVFTLCFGVVLIYWDDCPCAQRVFRQLSTGRDGARADAAAVAHNVQSFGFRGF
jgi:hypothetical protein